MIRLSPGKLSMISDLVEKYYPTIAEELFNLSRENKDCLLLQEEMDFGQIATAATESLIAPSTGQAPSAVRANHDLLGPNYAEVLHHAAWMAQAIRVFLDEGRIWKAHRWLGFIQGASWSVGFCSIGELKQINKTGIRDRTRELENLIEQLCRDLIANHKDDWPNSIQWAERLLGKKLAPYEARSDYHRKDCPVSQVAQDRKEYFKKWPKACRVCDGWGGVHSPGTTGGPPDRWEPPDFDPCDSCWMKCPRCGAEYKDDEKYERFVEGVDICSSCLFSFQNSEGAPAIEVWCDCGMVGGE